MPCSYNGRRVPEYEAEDIRWTLHQLAAESTNHYHSDNTIRREVIRRSMRLPDYAAERHLEDDWLCEVVDCVPLGRSDINHARS